MHAVRCRGAPPSPLSSAEVCLPELQVGLLCCANSEALSSFIVFIVLVARLPRSRANRSMLTPPGPTAATTTLRLHPCVKHYQPSTQTGCWLGRQSKCAAVDQLAAELVSRFADQGCPLPFRRHTGAPRLRLTYSCLLLLLLAACLLALLAGWLAGCLLACLLLLLLLSLLSLVSGSSAAHSCVLSVHNRLRVPPREP